MSDYIIGLTGGVAAGTSAVEACFRALGVAVADADAAARDALAAGSDGLAEVVSAFGPTVLGPEGQLDRAAMRRQVFADPEARKRLEAIVRQLEQGNAPLDESLKLFQEGTKLVQSCAKQLDSAEQEIVKLTKTADGTPAETEYVRDE